MEGVEKIVSSPLSQSSPEDQVVPEEGLEPSQGYPYRILSPSNVSPDNIKEQLAGEFPRF